MTPEGRPPPPAACEDGGVPQAAGPAPLIEEATMIKTMPQGEGKRTRKSGHPLKVTALWYLKEVLIRERYEECADIVETAKDFGASDLEINLLLEDPRRSPS